MNRLGPALLLLTIGALCLIAASSARLWSAKERRYRIGALVLGLVWVTMGALGLLGYMEIHD